MIRAMDARIETPVIPLSGINGVTYRRDLKRWNVKILSQGQWKYVGVKPTLAEAIAYQQEITGLPLDEWKRIYGKQNVHPQFVQTRTPDSAARQRGDLSRSQGADQR